MKIKFDSGDDIPLNIELNFITVTVVIRTIFGKNSKYYDQCFFR